MSILVRSADHRLLRDEASGILNWCLAGCADYLRDGLRPPDEVLAATRAYRAEQDPLGPFLSERCVLEATHKVTKRELIEAYRKWLERQGEDEDGALAAKVFAEKIREHGCEDVPSMRAGHGADPERGWRGIRLKTRAETAVDATTAEQSTENADN